MAEFETVGRLADLPDGALVRLTVGGARVALARRGDRVYAIADRCSHLGVPLTRGGFLDGCAVVCWLHGSRFDLRTGHPDNPPAGAPLATYEVRLHAGADGEQLIAIATTPRNSC